MRYRFDQFELDTGQYSLRASGESVHLEPLVFDLLAFFVAREGQVVTREAIIEHVWKGRFVSDATVASCIKWARKALGDSGERQSYIRTVRGRGFQFTAHIVGSAVNVEPQPARLQEPEGLSKRASPPKIAVFPLFPLSLDPQLTLIGDALAQEVIIELSRLHWLFVIARGSSFQFRGASIDLGKAGETLGADYFLTGTIMQESASCVIAVELNRAADSKVVWAERFTSPLAEIMHMRARLAREIVSALEPRVQLSEVMRAAHVPTEHLDAWAAYHRGLWHLYRFTQPDNEAAAHLFRRSVSLDPGFARAYAGLSFTHFQNAFLGFSPDRQAERNLTYDHARKSMELDPLDPFVNLTMGRAEWLSGELEAGLTWMERSVSFSPNYAFAIYNSALLGTILGEGEENEKKVVRAIALSPIDPLNYAMLATRALTHSIRGNYEAAALWAERATRSPGAHVQVHAIAAVSHELAGNRQEADRHVAHIRRFHPGYRRSQFFAFFPFRDGPSRLQMERSLERLGL
jgi:DNA-binding winged helix-turn-helix (wHTH) protein